MGIIENLVNMVTGGGSGQVTTDEGNNLVSSFGLGAFGDQSEIINKIVELTGIELSKLIDFASKVDLNLLGMVAEIGQGKFNFDNMEMVNSLKTQIGELDTDVNNTLFDIFSKLPIDQSMIEKLK